MNKKISFLLALVSCFTLALSATACETAVGGGELSDLGIVSDEISASENSAEEDVVAGEGEDGQVTVHKATIAELAAFNAEGVRLYDVSNGFHPTASPDSVNDQITGEYAMMEVAYTFTANETVTEAKESAYANWEADYYVYVDKDIEANTLGLAGRYASWDDGKWVAFYNPVAIKANEKVGLLASMAGCPWTYADVVAYVGSFDCGTFDYENACAGVTLTVELCLTNPDTGKVIVVSTTSYTYAE